MGWQQQVAVRIQRGELAALKELYDRMAVRVYRLAVLMTASVPVAEEITEAVFVEAWRSPESLLSHQDQLGVYLSHLACRGATAWRTRQAAERPTQAGVLSNLQS